MRYKQFLFLLACDAEKRLRNLEELGFSRRDIQHIVRYMPSVLCLTRKTVTAHFEMIRARTEYSVSRVRRMFIRCPSLFGSSEKRTAEVMDCFDRIGIPYDEEPAWFIVSPRVIRARYRVLYDRTGSPVRPREIFVSREQFRRNTRLTHQMVLQRDPGSAELLPPNGGVQS
jgi:hypothetical protein